MKRWLKKHGRWLVVGLGALFLADSVYWTFNSSEEWKLALHGVTIFIWIMLILFWTGAISKIFDWWEKE